LLALHTLRARLMVDGNSVKLLVALAQVERLLHDLGPAGEAAARAVALAPHDVAALKTLAAIALDKDDAGIALGALERVAAANPRDVEAQIGLGWALVQLGRDAEAAARWRPLIDATQDRELLLEMLRIYHDTGDREAEGQALAALRRLGRMP
jgi:Flp pilus assembly protein TadD